jgi:hypothetical protein
VGKDKSRARYENQSSHGVRPRPAVASFRQFAASPAPTSAWTGTWSGAWGGKDPTSIKIAGKRVVSYEYQGASTPATKSKVTPKRVIYISNGITVTLTRTGRTTAFATLHSSQGDATAALTRQ